LWFLNVEIYRVQCTVYESGIKQNCCDFRRPESSYPGASLGINAVAVEKTDGKRHILVYTFRGILDNYSGFIYVPGEVA